MQWDKLKKSIPPQISGYKYLKKVKIYIPILEIGLSILEKQEVKLSFVFETVLSLVSYDIHDIEMIQKVLGLDKEILKEIISQMAIEDLVSISEMQITLAPKGSNALHEHKKNLVVKSQLNKIFINRISGKLSDEIPYLLDKIETSEICLDSIITPTIEKLRGNHKEIDKIYYRQQERSSSYNELRKSSLYRILDIIYDNFRYMEKYAFIYLNEKDGSLLSIFNDDEDSLYATTLNNQIDKNIDSVMNMFKYKSNKNYAKTIIHESEMKIGLEELIKSIQSRDYDHNSEHANKNYYSSRYLLENEVDDFISSINHYKPKTIYIISGYLHQLFRVHSLIDAIHTNKCEVIIQYSSNESNIENFIVWLKREINGHDVKFVPVDNDTLIDYSAIICDPGFRIDINYEEVAINQHRVLFIEHSAITFSDGNANNLLSDISYSKDSN